ncbi:MAG: hypothetical protein MRY63_04505 [Neomegalonema sp.]|nr:hypothetical protein [Neomegalonema sp.]
MTEDKTPDAQSSKAQGQTLKAVTPAAASPASSDVRHGAPAQDGREEQIRALLRDEIARNEIREALESRRLFRHPIVVAIFGFFLTFVIGHTITSGLAKRAEEDLLRREALEAVRDFSAIAAERTERMALLSSAIKRGAALEELTLRKTAYDQSYVSWNANLQRNYLYLRERFGYTFKTFAEYAIDNSLGQIFAIYDDCLTETYDRILHGEQLKSADALESCLAQRGVRLNGRSSYVSALTGRLRACRDEIYGVLNHYVMKNIHCGKTGTWRRGLGPDNEPQTAVIEHTYNALMRLCEMQNPPELPMVSDRTFEASCTRLDKNGLGVDTAGLIRALGF